MPAIRKVLKLAGLSLDDIDLIELNEAFAAQVLACLRELPMDETRLNVNGGAIALGHPLGCTGAKLTTSLLYEMQRRAGALRPRDDVRRRRHGRRGNSGAVVSMTTCELRQGRRVAARAGDAASVLTPERLSDEHRLIAQTAREFAEKEVVPGIERLEQKDWAFARQLLQRAGELGLLGVDAPEEFGGVGLDKAAALVVSSHTPAAPRSARHSARRAISRSAPILYFGTAEQKARYLPKLISGEMVGAYALSESGSGSDALGASRTRGPAARRRLRADRREDVDHQRRLRRRLHRVCQSRRRALHRLHRRARVPGVSTGNEEHKMGLHGSSTTPLILQDAQVPAANLLGEIGKGHKVAFNVLNFGRFKLGAMCVGGATAPSAKRAVRRHAQAVRQADRRVRRDQAQARRDERADLRHREPALSHGRAHRRVDRAERRTGCGARGHGRVRRRSVDCQGGRQRDAASSCSTRTCRFTAATAS